MNAPFEQDVLPTPEEITHYAQHGWVLTSLVYTAASIEACRTAIRELDTHGSEPGAPWNAPPPVSSNDPREGGFYHYVSHRKRALGQLLGAGQLAAYAAALTGATVVRAWRDMLLRMPAGAGKGTGWHTDHAYWRTCTSDRLVSAWFCLDDCADADGCLTFVSGSHLWAGTNFVRKVAVDDIARLASVVGRAADEVRPTVVPHRRGQVSFHSCRVLHGARPNWGGRERVSFAVALQDGDNRYQALTDDPRGSIASFNVNDRVGPQGPDGRPDYTDPAFYPVLYDRLGSRSAR